MDHDHTNEQTQKPEYRILLKYKNKYYGTESEAEARNFTTNYYTNYHVFAYKYLQLY